MPYPAGLYYEPVNRCHGGWIEP